MIPFKQFQRVINMLRARKALLKIGVGGGKGGISHFCDCR